jgi:nickel/cobalt transporter (NicO) family protein
MRRTLAILFVTLPPTASAWAHDIPNARVDRSIQVTVLPRVLRIDYEVSLSELTLTRDLRNLIGTLPGADSREWFDRYGKETGSLNAKGLLVSVDGRPLEPRCLGFDLVVEEHPRYTFHLESPLPPTGRLVVQDTNFATSEGTSRIAVRGRDGVVVDADELPGDVERIAVRPLWQLSDAEERRTKQVEAAFRVGDTTKPPTRAATPPPTKAEPVASAPPARLRWLLDRSSGVSVLGLALIALGLGAAHAIQPGHGKTLVAATVVGEGGGWLLGAVLAIVTTVTHTGSVLLVAGGLWLTRSTRYSAVHEALAHVAGFVIAAIGLWRVGRHLGGYGEHDTEETAAGRPVRRRAIGLGVAGGLVPCWDAVALIVLAEAVGQLALGVVLLLAFGLGMATVLVIVGGLAARFRTLLARRRALDWERRLGVASGLALSAIGVYLLVAS